MVFLWKSVDKLAKIELFTRICVKASAYEARFSGVFHIFTRGRWVNYTTMWRLWKKCGYWGKLN